MAQGTDVNAMLPYLARFMGHASLDSTLYYIHTSPNFMGHYAAFTHEGQCVFPVKSRRNCMLLILLHDSGARRARSRR